MNEQLASGTLLTRRRRMYRVLRMVDFENLVKGWEVIRIKLELNDDLLELMKGSIDYSSVDFGNQVLWYYFEEHSPFVSRTLLSTSNPPLQGSLKSSHR